MRVTSVAVIVLTAGAASGKVTAGSAIVEATAVVKDGADAQPIRKATHRTFPVMVSLLDIPAFFVKLVRRKSKPECAIHLTFG